MTVPCSAAAGGSARRQDRGPLIVLDLHGSYAAMGRQQVELLGEAAHELRDVYAERWRGLVRRQGILGLLVDHVIFPAWSALGGWREDSGFFAEAGGIAAALDGGGADGVRLLYGGVFGGGSTVFAATRGATADGRAIIGRNVDWSDDGGRRRPVVSRYHPDNGDLVHLTASWPFVIVPIVGVNAAGLAMSINFFDADEMIGLGFPRILYRRVLQRARTVDEALALLTEDGNRGGSGILVLADATGALAVAECAASRCAVERPTGDWVARSNHALVPEMRARDEGRTADSARRLAAMEIAVECRLGGITPVVASEILRDRANSRFINDSTVANLRVLNALVVDPDARMLWHSTALQPVAPFGEMVGVPVDGGASAAPPLPAEARFAADGRGREIEAVAAMRFAARLLAAGRVGDAGRLWDRLSVEAADLLEPHRLAFARARARWFTGRLREADALLAEADDDGAPFEIRLHAAAARALIADREGRRADAVEGYRRAAAVLDRHPEYDAPLLVGEVRRWVEEGLAAPQAKGRLPAMPDFQCIPQ
jgi:hypothetical protein